VAGAGTPRAAEPRASEVGDSRGDLVRTLGLVLFPPGIRMGIVLRARA
jgi:hypothetical protein